MKRIALIMSLLCCMLSASAQDAKGWSIIPHANIGTALDFLYVPENHLIYGTYRADVGIDAKYSFNGHWSLLAGIECDYRPDKSVAVTSYRPYFRVPVRAEFSHKWFYVNFGPYLERTTRPWVDTRCYENFGYGIVTEIGGRIRLSANDRLRLGLQNQLGLSLITYHNDFGEKEYHKCSSFASALISLGYEHRF